jgi:hypothetical protein
MRNGDTAAGERSDDVSELADLPAPLIRAEVVDVAIRAVRSVGLPARLSRLLHACLNDVQTATPHVRQQGAEVLNLAVLWAFAPEDADDEGGRMADDLMARILGTRSAVDTDGTPLRLPGWDGDDVIVASDADALADANPIPISRESA